MSLLLNPRDLDFLLFDWLKVDNLCERPRFADHSRETFAATLQTAQKIAEEEFYPINKLLDQEEPQFDGKEVMTPPPLMGALQAYVDAGFIAAGQDFERGGMQLPHVVERASNAWFSAASAGASSYPMLTVGNANVILKFGTEDQKRRYAEPLLAGRFFGTMCLSEPQAGSSLGDIRTKAIPQPDGSYRLVGNKMWISGGEHQLRENIVHLVLAKVAGADEAVPPGVKSISLFIVPKVLVNHDGSLGERNDVSLAGLNHKMGYRGTTNCLLNFGEGQFKPKGQAGAIGQLIGPLNQGLSCMFHMMNEARIGVGMGAVTLGYAGYLHSLNYARNRPQGRHPSAKDPATPQRPIIEHADIKRMLLAQKSYVEGGLALELFCSRLVDDWQTGATQEERQAAFEQLELLTPIAKSWPSQWCLEANNLAIQVHGGYGYTRDYNVEQYYRDNRLNPIHEGTHGIQALDLLGRKVRINDGAVLRNFVDRMFTSIEIARARGNPDLKEHATVLSEWIQAIEITLKGQVNAPTPNHALANASPFLEAFGHVVVGWIWLEQALVAAERLPKCNSPEEIAFLNGKLAAARYFCHWELPKVGPWLKVVASFEATPLSMQDNWF